MSIKSAQAKQQRRNSDGTFANENKNAGLPSNDMIQRASKLLAKSSATVDEPIIKPSVKSEGYMGSTAITGGKYDASRSPAGKRETHARGHQSIAEERSTSKRLEDRSPNKYRFRKLESPIHHPTAGRRILHIRADPRRIYGCGFRRPDHRSGTQGRTRNHRSSWRKRLLRRMG